MKKWLVFGLTCLYIYFSIVSLRLFHIQQNCSSSNAVLHRWFLSSWQYFMFNINLYSSLEWFVHVYNKRKFHCRLHTLYYQRSTAESDAMYSHIFSQNIFTVQPLTKNQRLSSIQLQKINTKEYFNKHYLKTLPESIPTLSNIDRWGSRGIFNFLLLLTKDSISA